MPRKRRNPAAQRFWDEAFFRELERSHQKDGKRSEESHINTAMLMANEALAARRRSQQESP